MMEVMGKRARQGCSGVSAKLSGRIDHFRRNTPSRNKTPETLASRKCSPSPGRSWAFKIMQKHVLIAPIKGGLLA